MMPASKASAPEAAEMADLAVLRAEALLRSGRSREARDWLERTLPAVEGQRDRRLVRRGINLLGAARFDLGELAGARAAFERALDLGREDADDLLVARATNNLGAIANVRGERERALAMYGLALVAYQRLGDARGLAETYHNMAISHRHLGMLDRAEDDERRAIEFARAAGAGSVRLLALARLGRAEISLAHGDARLAEAAAMRVAEEFATLPDPIQQAGALRLAGEACVAQRKLTDARRLLDDALVLAKVYGSALDEAEILRTSAKEWNASGKVDRALEDATEALRLFERLDAREDREELARWMRKALGGE